MQQIFPIKRIYIDTSVFGGYFDKEFDSDMQVFFEKVGTENIQIVISDVLEIEIYKAPLFIIKFFESLKNIVKIQLSDADNLREGYQTLEIRTPKEIFDYEDHRKQS